MRKGRDGEKREKNGGKKGEKRGKKGGGKTDDYSGHYVIASSRPPERRPLERRTLAPIVRNVYIRKNSYYHSTSRFPSANILLPQSYP